jgi:hypothetical protein
MLHALSVAYAGAWHDSEAGSQGNQGLGERVMSQEPKVFVQRYGKSSGREISVSEFFEMLAGVACR